MRCVSPSGAPIRPSDIARWVRTYLGGSNCQSQFGALLASRFGVPSAEVVSTGRAALVIALRALRRVAVPTRTDVVIPSYTCYSVAASVAKAGLTPRIADVEPLSLDFTYDALAQMDHTRTLAIVATNLYGFPNDFAQLLPIARERGVFVVDDAAQALGATDGPGPVGARGDIGILSFDKGKNIAAIAAGALLCSPNFSAATRAEVDALGAASAGEEWSVIVKALAYSALLPPSVYWLPNSIPWLGLGQTRYSTDYPVDKCSTSAASLGMAMLHREAEFTAQRRQKGHFLSTALADVPGVTLVPEREGTQAAFLRLPVLFDDRRLRDTALVELNKAGIGATGSYPSAIADIPELQVMTPAVATTGGRVVAERIATLPTHPYVTDRDLDRIVAIVKRVCGAKATSAREASERL
jgi:dTDP-4-amino-4,6-dideoxygalactose transaminase